jgi:predicted enzyme related to lactoylglutathione lyase
MIKGVRTVGLYVGDQDRARTFWTESIGFELLQDVPMGEGPDSQWWIEVAPPDKPILVLFTPEVAADQIGKCSNVIFTCDNIQKTHEELSERGVEFAEPPSKQMWGWWAMFKDPDGNTYGLGQHSV